MKMTNDNEQIFREEKDHRGFTAANLDDQENAIDEQETIVEKERLERESTDGHDG